MATNAHLFIEGYLLGSAPAHTHLQGGATSSAMDTRDDGNTTAITAVFDAPESDDDGDNAEGISRDDRRAADALMADEDPVMQAFGQALLDAQDAQRTTTRTDHQVKLRAGAHFLCCPIYR